MRPLLAVCILLIAGCTGTSETTAGTAPDLPERVTLTWLSVTSWLLEAGDTRVLFDGYVSRVDRTTVNSDGTSTTPAPLDTTAVRGIRDALLADGRIDHVLVGHGHWDHAFDAPAWARLTGGDIIGARTVCLQAQALGVPNCTAVEGGETLDLGPHVSVRVVRWHHSGDNTVNGRRLRAPIELRSVPAIDSATGGLRPGYMEDYPNGGGSRAYLVTVRTTTGPVTLFWSNTGNPYAWDQPLPVDSAFFREQSIDMTNLVWATDTVPTRDALAAALAAASLDSVDLWIGFAGEEHVRQVLGVLHPRAFTPHHWDDFWIPLADGPGRSFPGDAVGAVLDSAGVELIVTPQYFDRVIVTPGGATLAPGTAVRRALNVAAQVRPAR